jgi:hypothetical protein
MLWDRAYYNAGTGELREAARVAPLGKPKRRVVVEPLPETKPRRKPQEAPVRREPVSPKRREKVPA